MSEFSLIKLIDGINDHIQKSDRSRFIDVIQYILSQPNLIFSIPELYDKKKKVYYPTNLGGMISYTFDNVKDYVIALEKEISKEYTSITYLKEVEEDKEYTLYVLSRPLLTIKQIQSISKKYDVGLINTKEIIFQNIKLKMLPPEVELINVYHKLYSPIDDTEWDYFNKSESQLIKILSKSSDTLVAQNKMYIDKLLHNDTNIVSKCKDILCIYRKYFVESLPYNDNLGILCGMWAVPILLSKINEKGLKSSGTETVNPKIIVQDLEKPQIITDLSIEQFIDNLTTLFHQWDEQKYTISISNTQTNGIPIIGDFRLTRTTIYININGESLPYIDVWNNSTYELIPYVYMSFLKTKIKMAHPYVLLRLLLIDYWILTSLSQYDLVKDVKQRLNKIVYIILFAHSSKLCDLIPIRKHTNYDGIWIEEKLAKKLIQQNKIK